MPIQQLHAESEAEDDKIYKNLAWTWPEATNRDGDVHWDRWSTHFRLAYVRKFKDYVLTE